MKKGKIETMKEDNKELNTIIGKNSIINGKLSIQNSIRIDGRIIGEVLSTGSVTIGSNGEVEGNIVALNAIVGGKVKGSVKASEKIILEANSILVGDLKTAKLTIDEGAMFEGRCLMTEDKENEQENKDNESTKKIEHKKFSNVPGNKVSTGLNNE